ncbi:netrin receptor UNC5D-like [Saccostrea cucullata]|uniref:netrin receptor UNC5D-like n=1 Tax=Saccostrea cuccullata TaxID=36930 RepID=UPI002ED09931
MGQSGTKGEIGECRKVHGGWSTWGKWIPDGKCNKSCGNGTQEYVKYRSCTNPRPRNGGRRCSGGNSKYERKACHVQNCTRVVDGRWSSWGSWKPASKCSKSCGNGTMTYVKYRSCTNPKPQNVGKRCYGESSNYTYGFCYGFLCEKACEDVPINRSEVFITSNNYNGINIYNIFNRSGIQLRPVNNSVTFHVRFQSPVNITSLEATLINHDQMDVDLFSANGTQLKRNVTESNNYRVIVTQVKVTVSVNNPEEDIVISGLRAVACDRTDEEVFLCPKKSGFFTHPTDKTKYYNCNQGEPTEIWCPEDTSWNSSLKVCK